MEKNEILLMNPNVAAIMRGLWQVGRQCWQFPDFNTMEIKEPQGIMFVNVLNDIFNVLKVDPSGIVFMLKTVFVGHADDGSADTIYNVNPFLFVLVDLTGYFDLTGYGYTLTLVGVENGITRLPQIAKIAQGLTINLKEKNTIELAMQKLQNTVNSSYSIFVSELKSDMAKQNLSIFAPDGPGKKVGYIIQIDDHYKNYAITEQQINKKDEPDDTGVISLGKSVDIESAIHSIMRKSNQVLEDEKGIQGSDGKNIKRYSYRLHSALESGPLAVKKYGRFVEDKQIEYFFIYKVVRYEVPYTSYDKILSGDTSGIAPGNLIEFDYFFSGKNIDILEFDIKMQMGLAFLYSISTTNNMYDTGGDTLKGTHNNTTFVSGSGQIAASLRPNTPVLFSSNSQDVLIRNSRHIANVTNFQALLSRFASLEGLAAKITILGNPRLLANTTSSSFSLTPNEIQEGDVMLNWTSQPGFAKVNIYFPTPEHTRDVKSSEIKDYRESFWYKGLYYIFQVDHIFEEGGFTQVLDMMSLPVDPIFETPGEGEESSESKGSENTRIPPKVEKDIPSMADVRLLDKSVLYPQQRVKAIKVTDKLIDASADTGKVKVGDRVYTTEQLQKRKSELLEQQSSDIKSVYELSPKKRRIHEIQAELKRYQTLLDDAEKTGTAKLGRRVYTLEQLEKKVANLNELLLESE
jgi:hypothetical protein